MLYVYIYKVNNLNQTCMKARRGGARPLDGQLKSPHTSLTSPQRKHAPLLLSTLHWRHGGTASTQSHFSTGPTQDDEITHDPVSASYASQTTVCSDESIKWHCVWPLVNIRTRVKRCTHTHRHTRRGPGSGTSSLHSAHKQYKFMTVHRPSGARTHTQHSFTRNSTEK